MYFQRCIPLKLTVYVNFHRLGRFRVFNEFKCSFERIWINEWITGLIDVRPKSTIRACNTKHGDHSKSTIGLAVL